MSGIQRQFTRRRFIGGVATGAAAVLLAACGAKPAANNSGSQTKDGGGAPAVITKRKMTYWGGLIFSDAANKMQVARIQEWGKQSNVDIDVVMINQNETNTKVSAAVESKTMPDALDMGLEMSMLLGTSGKLEALDALYDKIGQAHGGWIKSTAQAMNPAVMGGARVGIPFGASGNLLNIRKDALDKAGQPMPKTWAELKDVAEKVNKPPLYAMGFALSNVGDGNVQVQVLQSYGGRVADDAGKKCTIKSAETRLYLEWVTDAYKKGLFPPGVTTWDGAGDNNAYQSGQAVFIANPGSVYLWMKQNDKDLLASSAYSALPAGPKGRISPLGPNLRTIPKGGKNVDAAKDLLEALAEKAYMSEYFKVAIYGPVLTEQIAFDVFKQDVFYSGLSDLAQNGTGPAFPDVNNVAYADFNNNFIVPKMIQRVVIDKWDLDRAMDEAQKAGDAVYAKYNK